ncbi:MAG TPA: hypothetical protein VNG12_00125 [Acidimicrobiales bacterium]|nr:hypothetical protein [Acidimicrobiales bacterium]
MTMAAQLEESGPGCVPSREEFDAEYRKLIDSGLTVDDAFDIVFRHEMRGLGTTEYGRATGWVNHYSQAQGITRFVIFTLAVAADYGWDEPDIDQLNQWVACDRAQVLRALGDLIELGELRVMNSRYAPEVPVTPGIVTA